MNLRLKRLNNDYLQIQSYLEGNPYIVLKNVTGNPPEKYQFEYNIISLEIVNEKVAETKKHIVEISLPLEYPSIQPQCRMLTPVFHPNIAPHAICIADHWAAGESLKDVIIRIGEMLAYQNYSIKSPLNGEAAKWASENRHRFPIDHVDLRIFGSSIVSQAINEPTSYDNQLSNQTSINTSYNTQTERQLKCTNCGQVGTESTLFTCKNNHHTCSDCQTKCKICGKVICLICELNKCLVCGKIVCDLHYKNEESKCFECYYEK